MIPGRPLETADVLRWARGVVADVAHHPDWKIAQAASVVRRKTDDPAEAAEASALMTIIKKGKPS